MAHNTVYGSNITQAAILLCTKDNIYQRFVVDGDRFKDYQKQFMEKVEKFHKKLRDLYDAKFEYIDERLTTFEARQILKENKTDEVDANAAKILIDNWFEINKK
mgnify:CR=1 FL=1